MWILEIGLGLLVAVAFYNLIHHFLVVIPNRKKQRTVKRKTDLVVTWTLKKLERERLIPQRSEYIISSGLLSKVWGRGIFAYDYVLNFNFADSKKLHRFSDYFNESLAAYCRQHGLTTRSGLSLYVVAEAWCYSQKIHLNVAYVYNSATIDYLKDIHRL